MARRKANKFNFNLNLLELFEKEIHKAEENLKQIDLWYKKDLRKLDLFSDRLAEIGGSWGFILSFFLVLIAWVVLNTIILVGKPFDPYPFILLNLALSCLAAIQAPVILMSQARAAKRDQVRVELDLEKDLRDLHVDLESHKILLQLRKDVDLIKEKLDIK